MGFILGAGVRGLGVGVGGLGVEVLGSGRSFRDLGFRIWFERRILRLEAKFSGGLLGGPWGTGKQVSNADNWVYLRLTGIIHLMTKSFLPLQL